MKMKKLLAGVLSATMVATMIPASMAFSSVSAEGEGNGLVASYDFTKGQTDNWAAYSGETWVEGSEKVTVDETGMTIEENRYHSYSIANPLKGKVTDEYTVIMDVMIPTTQAQNVYEGLFGFSNHTDWFFCGVSNNGYSMRMNAEPGGVQNYFQMEGIAAAAPIQGKMSRYVFTVDSNSAKVYVDGVFQREMTSADFTGETKDVSTAFSSFAAWANDAAYFDLGYACAVGNWRIFASPMTVENVSLYNTAMTADEVAAEYIASQLDLEVVGMQKGTLEDASDTTAIRFVANMDGAMTNQYNNGTIVNVGWAWEANTAFSENYTPVAVSTVTSDSNLLVDTNDLAYTMVFASSDENDYYSIVPYVDIQVNGQTYTFCYNGRGASYQSSSSDMVYAPVNFVGAGA